MRSFVTMILSASLVVTPFSTFGDICDQVRKDCKAALSAADQVIEKQDKEISLLKDQETTLFKEKDSMQLALEQDQHKLEVSERLQVEWGLVGVIIGGIAGAYIVHELKQ